MSPDEVVVIFLFSGDTIVHMSLTESNKIELGMEAPDFSLPDTVSGETFTRDNVKGEHATVVMFICNHCPYVRHINHEIINISKEYMSRGVSFVAISANDAEAYPQDGPDEMKKTAEKLGYDFPYLYDETQDIAKAYGASCTPDLFIYDAEMKLAYHGQLDDSRLENDLPVTGESFRKALNEIIKGEVPKEQIPSIGCSIKWR